ncbi:MAG: TetR/AcrR family transcriptional regulator [Planctomycetes bacterium]|nr:TetR/AcrR family transcriptional regulator [Planctomycetota bacterium]
MTDRQSVSRRPGRAAAGGRGRGARRDDRRRALLEAARGRFLALGYEGTSVAAIVREAGVAQGTFYLYFRSKEHVLLHLRAEVLASYLAALRSGAAGSGRADERLLRGLERIGDEVRRHHALLRVFRQAAGRETERVRLEGRAALAAPLAALIAAGEADGSLRVDDPTMAAHLLLALLDDLIYEALEYERPAAAGETLAHAGRFMLRALGASEARVEALRPLRRGRREARGEG